MFDSPKLLIPQKKSIFDYLREYFVYGGYPGIVMEPDYDRKKEMLKDLYMSLLQKDIYESGVKNEIKFYELLKIMASQSGELLNVNELSNTLKISRDAIQFYLYVMEKSFVIKRVNTFHNNIRIELTKMPKSYFVDTGYRNAVLNNFDIITDRSDKGASFENLVFCELFKQGLDDIRFWRTKNQNEVDFVVNRDKAFEVKFTANKFKASKYKTFAKLYSDIPLECISYHGEDNSKSIIDFLS